MRQAAAQAPRAGEIETRAGPAGLPPTALLVMIVVGIAVALRVPFLGAPAGPDEAGFLQVASQWSTGDGSLYGRYWVDRPPLLIGIYQLAAATGGVESLRLIGCAAISVTILASACAAEAIGGRSAARWTAVVAAALLVAPQLGAEEVDGELLAAPFVALGILALVTVGDTRRPAAAASRAAAGGMAAAGAALVKQNFVDVFVFAVVLALASWLSQGDRTVRPWVLTTGFVAGAAAVATVVGGWAVLHGTSLPDAWSAMYAFRVQAAHVVASEGGWVHAQERAADLGSQWARSGLALVTVVVAASVRRWARQPVMVALAATMAFDLVSVAVGGAYWRHYLIQLVVPLAISVGVLAGRTSLATQAAALMAVCLPAYAALGAAASPPATTPSALVGATVARAAQPGDTLTTLYGDPRINLAAELPSPYEHLWSLPIKARDPRLVELHAVLAGRTAPTWLVVLRGVRSWGLDTRRVAALIEARYHPVGECDGVRIYLRERISRPALDCRAGATRARDAS